MPPGPHASYVLSYVVPDPAWYAPSNAPTLTITRGACTLAEIPLQSGTQVAVIEDRCSDAATELRLRSSSRLDAARIAPDTRPLAWLFRSLELYPPAPDAQVEAPR